MFSGRRRRAGLALWPRCPLRRGSGLWQSAIPEASLRILSCLRRLGVGFGALTSECPGLNPTQAISLRRSLQCAKGPLRRALPTLDVPECLPPPPAWPLQGHSLATRVSEQWGRQELRHRRSSLDGLSGKKSWGRAEPRLPLSHCKEHTCFSQCVNCPGQGTDPNDSFFLHLSLFLSLFLTKLIMQQKSSGC